MKIPITAGHVPQSTTHYCDCSVARTPSEQAHWRHRREQKNWSDRFNRKLRRFIAAAVERQRAS